MLDGLLQLILVDFIDKVDLLKGLRPRHQGFLVADDVAVVRRCVGCINVKIDWSTSVSALFQTSIDLCGMLHFEQTHKWSS